MSTATTPGAVVVGVDGSEDALRAVRWSAVEARSVHRPLHLVHASIWPLINHPLPPGVTGDYHKVMEQEAHGWLHRARKVAEDAGPGVGAEERLVDGAASALLAESAHAREVVVGSRGLGGFTGLLVGSTAAMLAHHARCPVVVVRAEGDPSGPVVVGIDGSETSERALSFAFDAASRAGAPLLALHTWSDVGIPQPWAPRPRLVNWQAVEEDEYRVLAERLAGWREKYPDVTVERVVALDRPAHRLLEAGRQARLLVVGSHGRGGFAGMLLGSVSRVLVYHAPCPLAVVRS